MLLSFWLEMVKCMISMLKFSYFYYYCIFISLNIKYKHGWMNTATIYTMVAYYVEVAGKYMLIPISVIIF